MGRISKKENKNIYQTRREELGLSRDKASELLETITPERIEKIENGKVGDELTLTICRIDPNDYSVSKFDVKVKLVADTGTTS